MRCTLAGVRYARRGHHGVYRRSSLRRVQVSIASCVPGPICLSASAFPHRSYIRRAAPLSTLSSSGPFISVSSRSFKLSIVVWIVMMTARCPGPALLFRCYNSQLPCYGLSSDVNRSTLALLTNERTPQVLAEFFRTTTSVFSSL